MSEVLETTSASVVVKEGGMDVAQVNQYQFLSKLGEGASGEVFECYDESTTTGARQHFAIKCFPSKSLLKRKVETMRVGRKMTEIGNAFEDVLKEIAIMKKISHPNLVHLVEIIDDAQVDRLFMVLELVEGGTIMSWDQTSSRFVPNPLLASGLVISPHFTRLAMRDCIRGLDYLHSAGIIHRDLKPQNLLFDRHRAIFKIADFGTSLEAGGGDAGTPSMVIKPKGTFAFYAPELCSPHAGAASAASNDGYRADVWALGVCLFCFATGELPFYDVDVTVMFDQIRNAPIPFERVVAPHDDDGELELLKVLLERDTARRPGNAGAIMELPSTWLGVVERDAKSTSQVKVTEEEIHSALSVALRVAGFAKHWQRRAIAASMQRAKSLLRVTDAAATAAVADGSSGAHAVTPPRTMSIRHFYSRRSSDQPMFERETSGRSLASSSNNTSARSLPVQQLGDSQRLLAWEEDVDDNDGVTTQQPRQSLPLEPVVEEEVATVSANLVAAAADAAIEKEEEQPPVLARNKAASINRRISAVVAAGKKNNPRNSSTRTMIMVESDDATTTSATTSALRLEGVLFSNSSVVTEDDGKQVPNASAAAGKQRQTACCTIS